MELRNSKAKLFCETSFKNGASKLQNEAFLRDFLQKWSFGVQKRSFSARSLQRGANFANLNCLNSTLPTSIPSNRTFRARIGSQATTKGTQLLYVAGVGLQAHLVTCDPICLCALMVPNVETVNRVTSDQCTCVDTSPKLDYKQTQIFFVSEHAAKLSSCTRSSSYALQ